MFAQLIEAKVKDRQGLQALFGEWMERYAADAPGFLGSTHGFTDDGNLVALARFSSEASARENESRPDQDDWWNRMLALLDGEPQVIDIPELVLDGGGSDDAGFVQIMVGKTTNPTRLAELSLEMGGAARQRRPEIIGSVSGIAGDRYVIAVWFTDEASARQGEQLEPDPELKGAFDEMNEITSELRYIDLHEPVLLSP